MRKPVGAAVVAAMVLLVTGGCEGSTPVDQSAGGVAGGVEAPGLDPHREAPAAPIAGATAGGTVRVLAAASPEFEPAQRLYLDPTGAYGFVTLAVLRGLVTRSLTQLVYDPAQESVVLVPDIATDLGTPNADFTEWSFTIREGVRFENGQSVTAADVAFGIKRSFDKPTFPEGPHYSNDFFLNGDNYRGPYTSGTDYSGVVVHGDTVTLKMARPFPDMPHWAAFPAVGPIPEQGSNPATYWRHPLATGPYKFGRLTLGKSLTLVRNDEWDPATDPGRHAYPDRYVFRFGAPAKQIDASILGRSRQGETTLSTDHVSAGNYRKAKRLDRLTVGASACSYAWFPDYRKVTDIRVREAIGYALPYDHDAASGFLPPTSASILPPGFPGRLEYSVLDTEPGETDPEKAQALLQTAGYGPGEYELKFAWSGSAGGYVKNFEAAGFKTTPYVLPTFGDVIEMGNDENAPLNLRFGGWCPDWVSAGSWIPPLLSEGVSSYFAEPAVDKQIDRVQRLPFQEQPAAWLALDKSIMTKYYPFATTGYDAAAMLHGSRIGGVNVGFQGQPTWQDIYIKR